MKIVREEYLIDRGGARNSDIYQQLRTHIVDGIAKVVWPTGSDVFTIYPKRKGNGVGPIKEAFISHLKDQGWVDENHLKIGTEYKTAGGLDATFEYKGKYFAVEWETGNISSSHRAVNKMVAGMLNGILFGGALVFPTRKLYKYLTDRIGNYEELSPYFNVWKSVRVDHGLLVVFAIEHDAESMEVPRILKGTDGRALR